MKLAINSQISILTSDLRFLLVFPLVAIIVHKTEHISNWSVLTTDPVDN